MTKYAVAPLNAFEVSSTGPFDTYEKACLFVKFNYPKDALDKHWGGDILKLYNATIFEIKESN